MVYHPYANVKKNVHATLKIIYSAIEVWIYIGGGIGGAGGA